MLAKHIVKQGLLLRNGKLNENKFVLEKKT